MPDAWIREWGDPTLRQRALPVERLDDILRRQIVRMQELLDAVGGAGLAGPQIGLMRRVFVYRLEAGGPMEALVNPRIVAASDELERFAEGCLSFNTVLVEVQRPVAVRVEGTDLAGRTRGVEAVGFGASLLQHETDHLDGILTLDRATPAERMRAVEALRAGERRVA